MDFYRPATVQTTYRDGKRIYEFDGATYDSVTTILDMLNKPALVRWAAKLAAEYAVERKAELYPLPEEEAVALIKGAPWRASGKAARMGTAVHEAAEAISKGLPVPTPQDYASQQKIQQFEKFAQSALGIQLVAAEVTCYNKTHSYAGTLDLMASIGGDAPIPIDIKTGKAIYPEHYLQITAYQQAEFYDWDGQRKPMPGGEVAAILHLQQTQWKLIPIKITDQLAAKFFALAAAYRWKEVAEAAVGTPHIG